MKQTLLACALPLLLACGTNVDRDDRASTSRTTPPESRQPNNTGVNERDRGDATLTPGDQGESETDRTITRDVRRAIVDDDTLSTTAANVKIITIAGVVTLRGPVRDERERALIASKAQQVTGVARVDNQLEIVTQ